MCILDKQKTSFKWGDTRLDEISFQDAQKRFVRQARQIISFTQDKLLNTALDPLAQDFKHFYDKTTIRGSLSVFLMDSRFIITLSIQYLLWPLPLD